MTRDPELLIKLLLELKSKSDNTISIQRFVRESDDAEKRLVHLRLLADKKLVERSESGKRATFRLTDNGHTFIEKVVEPGILKSLASASADEAKKISLDVMKDILSESAKNAVGHAMLWIWELLNQQ